MSAHLLQISAERLAKLPAGVLVYGLSRTGRAPKEQEDAFLAGFATVSPLCLDLTDTVTAAVVAACVVWPWLDEHIAPEDWRVVESALHMEPLMPEQIGTLARLARAALEVA